MEAYKVCISWSLLNLSSIPYEKNVHGNEMTTILAQFIVVPTLACNIDLIISLYLDWNSGK